MKTFTTLCILALSGLASSSSAGAELKLLPAESTLSGPQAHQRLLLVSEADRKTVADVTGQATFTSSNPAVATVDAQGVVRSVADGHAVITAMQNGKPVTARVTVVRSQEPPAPSFRNQVIPLLTKVGCNSGACHGALAGKGGLKLSLRGYDPDADHFVLTRQALGRRVDRQEPSHSLLLLKPTLAVHHGGGQKLEAGSSDYQVLADWIAAGASGPRAADPHIQQLEVFPTAAVLKPSDTLQVLVRARYSDGHTEEVTPWAKFASTEELVAGVDQDGKTTVKAHGEAAITIWYSNLVATMRITAPLPNPLAPQVFRSAERRGFIDELVLKKLEALRIPPSGPCTDQEFLRRAYLDTAGILPTPEEVQRFLAEPAPDRRARLIEALLQRPEFIDYWTHKWSDLLLVSTRKLPQQAVWAFHQYIRQSVADNKPWDQFARAILTATGSNLHNGAANYFVLHKDVAEVTEATALTFLGTSITCARCHNHPLEKWTQDQYWSMANLFSRVALKNGDRAGEISVQVLPFGDVPHLRRGVPMPPTPLDGKAVDLGDPRDRRQAFADWLTGPENPFFARAVVNRVWRNFLGRGLVEAEDDLRQTNPPTNEELLDALVKDFITQRYDVKHLIRTIMNSATYQRSSTPLPGNAADDRFYSRYLVRRLAAEVVLDAYSQVTRVATPFNRLSVGTSGGTAATALYPSGTRALQLPDSQVVSQFLDSFGRAERSQTCSCERQSDSSVGQALHLNNGQTLNDKLRDKQSRVEQWVKEKVNDEDAIRRLFMLALCREPTAGEQAKFKGLLAEAANDGQTTRREMLEDLFWAVLTGREFLFNR